MKAWDVLAYTRDGAVYCDDCGAGLPDDDETGAWFADDEESLVGQTCNTCTACYMPDGDGWTPHESAVRDYRWSECQACGTQRPWQRADSRARRAALCGQLTCNNCLKPAVHF